MLVDTFLAAALSASSLLFAQGGTPATPPSTPPGTPPVRVVPPAGGATPTGAPRVVAPTPAAPVSTGDAELDALQKQFSSLSRWLVGKPAIGPDEHAEISRFRLAASTYSAAHPDNAAVVAMLAQAAAWINDDEDVHGRFTRLAALRPGDGNVIASWAEYWLRQSQPETALRVIDTHDADLATSPRLALVKAQALAALDRWADAATVVDAIPATAALPPLSASKLVEARRVIGDCAAAWPAELALREQEAKADDLPRVELITDRGRVVLELFENEAPNTVANFISLVEKGFYDGTRFHRVMPGFMAQGGDPNTKPGGSGAAGAGGPGYVIADECARPDARKHFTGTLAMAHRGANTGGSQFYITFAPPVHLNGVHTVFGRVVEGMPVVNQTSQNDEIKSAKVLRKRSHEYSPVTEPEPPMATSGTPSGATR